MLHAEDAIWRESNATKVWNTDLGGQLKSDTIAARFWRLRPGQMITKHRHFEQRELYVVIEGTGRMRIGEDVLTLPRFSSVLVDPDTVRQPFNDLGEDCLWLIAGTPRELANTVEMAPEQIALLYPDGPQAAPPELS